MSNHELGEVERVTPTADTASSHSTGLRGRRVDVNRMVLRPPTVSQLRQIVL